MVHRWFFQDLVFSSIKKSVAEGSAFQEIRTTQSTVSTEFLWTWNSIFINFPRIPLFYNDSNNALVVLGINLCYYISIFIRNPKTPFYAPDFDKTKSFWEKEQVALLIASLPIGILGKYILKLQKLSFLRRYGGFSFH